MDRRILAALLAAILAAPAAAPAEEGKTADEKIDEVKGKVESQEEQLAEVKVDLSSLKRLKFSGYVQARYQYFDGYQQETGSTAALSSGGGVSARDGFTVRRGRLKAAYEGSMSELVLQIDAVPAGVTLKDAEATLKLPWLGASVTVGQTKWPFGYEVLQSSSDRQMPERSRVVGAFASGERDRGARLQARYSFVNLKVGIFNGNGTNYAGWAYDGQSGARGTTNQYDNDREKDVVGRLGVDLGWLVAGVSGWSGLTYRQSYTPTGGTLQAGKYYERTRLGADAQVYLDLLPVGGTALKGEYIAGKTPVASGVEQIDVPAWGYYLLLSQALWRDFEVVARWDVYDGQSGADPTASAAGVPGARNRVDTLGVGALWYATPNLKVTVTYEKPWTELPDPKGNATDPRDDTFTIQAQARF